MNCLDCGSTMERGGTFAVNDVRAHQIGPGYICPDCSTPLKEAPISACLGCAVTAVECEEREDRKLQLAQHITCYPAGHIVVATRGQSEQEEWREADQRQRYRDARGVL